jgi:hypothetical protein
MEKKGWDVYLRLNIEEVFILRFSIHMYIVVVVHNLKYTTVSKLLKGKQSVRQNPLMKNPSAFF